MKTAADQLRGSQFSTLSRELLLDEARRALKSESVTAREDVLFATWRRGHQMGDLAEEIEALFDTEVPQWLILRACANMHHCSDRVIEIFRSALADPEDPQERCDAHLALQELAPLTAPLIPLLMERLEVEEVDPRLYTIGSLASMGPLAHEAVPRLIEEVKSRKGERKKAWWNFMWEHLRLPSESAAMALGKTGDPRAVPVLIEALGRGNRDMRWAAVRSLGQLGPLAKDAVPDLIRLARRRDEGAVIDAIRALRSIGDSSPEVIDFLVRICKRRGRRASWLRPHAVLALGVLGGSEREVTDLLMDYRDGKEQHVSLAARIALREVDEEMFALWRTGIEAKPYSDVMQMTGDYLATLGPAARGALPEICSLIEEYELWNCSNEPVLDALVAIDPESPDVHQCLDKLSRADNSQWRVVAWRVRREFPAPPST